jgi:sortase A
VRPSYKRGERIGEIEVPRLHLKVPVFEGDDAAILDLGAGHVPGTALPPGPGNICIAAHRDKFFRALRFIHANDEIVLDTAQGALKYTVDSTTIVKPTQTDVLLPGPGRDLTLVTCYPFYYVGSAPKRFIVHALRENRG